MQKFVTDTGTKCYRFCCSCLSRVSDWGLKEDTLRGKINQQKDLEKEFGPRKAQGQEIPGSAGSWAWKSNNHPKICLGFIMSATGISLSFSSPGAPGLHMEPEVQTQTVFNTFFQSPSTAQLVALPISQFIAFPSWLYSFSLLFLLFYSN